MIIGSPPGTSDASRTLAGRLGRCKSKLRMSYQSTTLMPLGPVYARLVSLSTSQRAVEQHRQQAPGQSSAKFGARTFGHLIPPA